MFDEARRYAGPDASVWAHIVWFLAYYRSIGEWRRGGSGRWGMKTYQGSRTIDGIRVTVDGQQLEERYDLQRFTDSGFEWTYEGKEPAQLALALLADHLGDDSHEPCRSQSRQ